MTSLVRHSALEQAMSPVDYLLHWTASKGDSIYLTQPLAYGQVQTFTWSEVADQALRLANFLYSLNLPAQSNIILLGKNSAHWLIADLAIWMAGHVSVPLYATLNPDSASYIIEHCQAKLIFVGKMGGADDSWQQLKTVFPAELPVVALPLAPATDDFAYHQSWENIMRDFWPLTVVDKRDAEALATIVYTSGTTGKPKGVMHCYRSLIAPCQSTKQLWHPGEADRMLSYLPLAHIAERVAVEIPSLVFGFQVFFNDSLETFSQDLRRARPTRFFSVPRLWTKFYQAVSIKLSPRKQKLLFTLPLIGPRVKQKILRQLGLDCTRLGLTGAAPLPANIVAWYRSLGLEFLEVFGMTENAATSHGTQPGQVRPGYVGVPLPGVECKIDATGEILVKSPGQMLGYYKNAEATLESYDAEGYFRTGDRGELDEQGNLRITGRVKELFKTSKGKYVAPVPIENKLAHPALEVVCVTGPGQPQPFALAVLAPGAISNRNELEHQFSELLTQVNSTLEDHEQLDYLVIAPDAWTIESGMLTPTMKLRRDKIEARYLANADHWRSSGHKIIWQ
ncbi:AMP-binding protein [Halioxenophilus sp. WMMB6]|uniref:AMP-binding protein n=1 Tax=Halioxenophilus sp. WMMB6 TaxID=3073815 RepID=UPI00295E5E1A|nr:AMP-binding protein [Halioxenophilus sp. WMMB6]